MKKVLIITITLYICICNSEAQIRFSTVIIDDSIPGAYQVSAADINQDGKPDIAGLSSSAGVYWYENPSWEKHPISTSLTSKNIDLDFYDVDQDGQVELALAYNFDLNNSNTGSVAILKQQKDLSQEWQMKQVAEEPTVHRLRWADVNHDGKKEIVAVPIIGKGAGRPEYNQAPARQFVLYPPEKPMQKKWQKEIFDSTLHITHGMYIWKHPTIHQDVVLIAGVEGVTGLMWKDNEWEKKTFCAGAPIEEGRTGSSEVAVGYLNDKEPYFATIEPWHGHQVVVYMDRKNGTLTRFVIDDSYDNGHALACADFDKDGEDEIIGGYRGKDYGVYLYDYDNETKIWSRQIVDDDGLAAQGFFVADFNQDGWLDFVGAGGATQNIKLYLNKGKK